MLPRGGKEGGGRAAARVQAGSPDWDLTTTRGSPSMPGGGGTQRSSLGTIAMGRRNWSNYFSLRLDTAPPTPSPLRAEDSLTSPRRGERASSVARSVRRERRRGLCGTFSRFASFDQMAQIWHFDEFVITPLFDLVRRRLFVVSLPARRVVATSGRCPFFSPMSFKSSGRKKRREKKRFILSYIGKVHFKSFF